MQKIYKAITFFILSSILLLTIFSPKVFAETEDSISFKIEDGYGFMNFEVSESNMKIETKENASSTTIDSTSNENNFKELLKIFESIEWEDDEDYNSYHPGYELKICKDGKCEKYMSNEIPKEYYKDIKPALIEYAEQQVFSGLFIFGIIFAAISLVTLVFIVVIFTIVFKTLGTTPKKLVKDTTFSKEKASDTKEINNNDFLNKERKKEKRDSNNKHNPFDIE